MAEEKWTMIDKPTQYVSLILILIGLTVFSIILYTSIIFNAILIIYTILVIDVFLLIYYGGRRIEVRKENDKKLNKLLDIKILITLFVFVVLIFSLSSSLADSLLMIIYFFLIIGFLVLLCYIGRRIELRNQTLKKYGEIKKLIDLKIIISLFITFFLIISIIHVNDYIYNSKLDYEKSYSGLSIKEVRNNYEKYLNQSVTFEAWYEDNYENAIIRQYNIFGKSESSIRVHIDYNQVDTSMLMRDYEYIFNGTYHREPRISEYSHGNETYTYHWNYTYLEITGIEPNYNDSGLHNISKFIGHWKLIEQNNKPTTTYWDWIFYENNSLKYISSYYEEWNRFTVDGDRFYYEYYQDSADGMIFTEEYYADYYFFENDTKFRIENLTFDKYGVRDITRVFQKVEDTGSNLITVDNSGDDKGNFTSIGTALLFAEDGDEIYVFNGTYNENIDIFSKRVNLTGESRENTIIKPSDPEDETIYVYKTNGVKIKNFTIYGINSSDRGIYLYNSSNCEITGNNFYNCHSGVFLYKNSQENIISENKFMNNTYGIDCYGENNNYITKNDIVYNEEIGISGLGENCTVYQNNISHNHQAIDGYWSINCSIYNNTISNNMYGIWLYKSGCKVYQNNFIKNNYDALSYAEKNWYNEELNIGNYWDYYTGEDIDADGIGDTSFNLTYSYSYPDSYVQDLYPLMNPVII